MFVGTARSLPRMVLHSGKLQPYLQTLDEAGMAYQGQTLQLIMKIRKLQL
jgi:hypothetical protein